MRKRKRHIFSGPWILNYSLGCTTVSFLLLCNPDRFTHSPSPVFENSIRDPFFKWTHRYCLTTVTGRSGSVCVCGSPSGRPCQCLCSSTRFFKSHGLQREEKKWVWIIGLLLKEWRREGTSERKWEWDGRNIKDKQIPFHFPGHPRAAALVVIM